VIVVAIVAAELLLLGRRQWTTGAPSVVGALRGPSGNVEQLAEAIFTRYLFAFEATSVLLVIAVVSAVALARRADGTDVDADYVAEVEAADAALAAERAASDAAVDELEAEEEAAEAEESGAEVTS